MNKTFFPYRLFLWFVSRQILISALGLLLLSTGIFFWLGRQAWTEEAIESAQFVVWISLLLAFVLMVTVSLFMARRLVVPLGRLIDRTRRLRKFPFEAEEMTEEDLAYDEPGEWFELERALNLLGRDLKQKTIRLSREKTELRTIMSAISEAVLAVNQERRLLFFNPQFALIFGRDTGDDAEVSEIVREPEVLEAFDQCLKSGETARVEVSLQLQDGFHDFQVSVAPLKKKHNQEVYGAVGVFHDITELKKAERIRIEFVGNVSHELRTPLTSIKGYIQTLLQDYEKGQMQEAGEFLQIVAKNVDRLMFLVGDLLDLSSLESGAELNRSRVSLREITELVVSQVHLRDHVVVMHYDLETMEADAPRVEQVLRNLLQNAARYVPKGKRIEINWLVNDKGEVELRVKDDGPGIPLEHQERLFERFYRIDEARSRELGGTGIGLSLVKHIMQRHGGHVRVQSELGRGAEFICTFPQ